MKQKRKQPKPPGMRIHPNEFAEWMIELETAMILRMKEPMQYTKVKTRFAERVLNAANVAPDAPRDPLAIGSSTS